MDTLHQIGAARQPDAEHDVWAALFHMALTARQDLTAAIHAAVSATVAGHDAQPAEVCLALTHVLAEHAGRTAEPGAALGAAFRMAGMLTGVPRPANDRR